MMNYNAVWQRAAVFLGPVILTLLICIKWTDPGFTWLAFLYWVHLALIMIHETEEYVFPGGFTRFVNTETILGKNPPEANSPATPGYTLFVNMSIWIWAVLGGLTADTLPWIGMGLIFFQIVINGIQHTAIFQIKKTGYNPGFITTWLILNPFCVVTIFYGYKSNIFTTMDWVLALIVGMGYIGILMANTMRLRKKGTPSTGQEVHK
jgi:hypothetical protein